MKREADASLKSPISNFQSSLATHAREQLRGRSLFHWAVEFPEVFARGGFDAFIGNPPFMGGQKITGAFGKEFRDFIVQQLANGQRGSADLCAYFFLRAYMFLRAAGGMFGLLATNTIAQGDTREVGLDQIATDKQNQIIRAVPSSPWPGVAALEVAHVWLRRGDWAGEVILADKQVSGITPFLSESGGSSGKPQRLEANASTSFQGSIALGMGFVLLPAEAEMLITKNPKNKNVLFPYLGGDDINSRPDHSPSRWAINFQDWPLDRSAGGEWSSSSAEQRGLWLKGGSVPADYPDPVAADYQDCLKIVEERVKPERMALKGSNPTTVRRRAFWWLYGSDAKTLYQTVKPLGFFLIRALTSKHHGFVFCPTGVTVIQTTSVVALNTNGDFALLQSEPHNIWALEYGNKLETRPQYTTSDCFETFPFPTSVKQLSDIGERYYTFRSQLMLARGEGLTKTYNHFHDRDEQSADISRLRALHVEMDQAVAIAYGWSDLDLGHGFHATKQGERYTLSEPARRTVLDRLLALNHQRYEEEVKAGLHDKKKSKGKSSPTKADDTQKELF